MISAILVCVVVAGDVGYVNNPNFEYESTSSYTLTVYASDGTNISPGDVLTVNIEDINEMPSFNNLPGVVTLSEGTQSEAAIFTVRSNLVNRQQRKKAAAASDIQKL